ncbi:hypothetical protein [Microbispora sp. ATCC PTA-5024]|uniref:hypothetical protein n=1 Tax=Microbispora sp. ATCC PTA-5024 TaxID=316330 RepID=UPI0012ED0744|nr:hypothetical protein [Microbispora sp. ATCC PTA-5024]
MAAAKYCARTQDGYRVADPSRVALAVLVEELHPADNTYMIVRPRGEEAQWHASVSLWGENRYAVVFRDPPELEFRREIHTDPRRAARSLFRWLRARPQPADPPRPAGW